MWQWTLTVACAADQLDDALDQRPELGRDGVADGVGDVDRRGAGLDDRGVDLEQVVEVGARGVLGRELDLGVAPELLAPVADPADGLGERGRAVDPELVLEVDVAGRDEHVEMRPLGDPDRLDRALRVAVLAAGQGGDGDPAAGLLGDPPDGLEVAGEAAGKPASMTSTLSRASWRATSSFSAAVRPAPGRLLAVAQGGVEDADGARRDERSGGPGYGRAHRAAPGRRGRRLGLAGHDLDRVEERHLGREARRRPAR